MQHVKAATVIVVIMMVCCWSLPAAAEVGFGFKGGMLIPDQAPFKDEFDSNYLMGGVLELDSNLGLTLEASVEYFQQNSNSSLLGGELTLFPIVVSAKYNFLPRYRTTPFVGLGVGAFFFDRDYANGSSKAKTRFGARVSAGIRFLEDRNMNLVLEAARNFVDFDDDNASSYQVTFSFLVDLEPGVVGAP